MLPRPHACHGAVQRHLPTHLESLWISDDILRHEWRRFVLGSKISRRYGSFVPGPLEARRRMGKRRMAHLSADFPPPLPSIASLWGSFWEVDRSQWQWEAPRKRDLEPESPASTPSRVQDKVPESVTKSKVTANPSPGGEILAFRSKIKSCNLDELPVICTNFNQLFNHYLTHGMVSETEIIGSLRGITKDLRHVFPSAAESQCLLFYKATWEGLVACKMLRRDYLGNSVTKVFMDVFSELSMTSVAQELALSVIGTLSQGQLDKTAVAISSVVKGIVCSWLQTATNLPDSKTGANKTLHLFPEELGKVLRCLPKKALSTVLRSSSVCISQFHERSIGIPMDLRHVWLSLVSQIPNACNWRDKMFLSTWKTMEASGAPLKEELMSPILLQYCISQGILSTACRKNLDKNFYKLVSKGETGLGKFLLLLERRIGSGKHTELTRRLRGQITDMLFEVGQYETLYNILSTMKKHRRPLPMHFLGRILEATSASDPALALRFYRKCVHIGSEEEQKFFPELCPNFVLSLVDNPNIARLEMWQFSKIPPQGSFSTLPRLRNEKIDLITRLAVAFARSKTRPPRVILRNVSRCLMCLRGHQAALSPDLSRAVTHSAINLKIEFNKTVPQERAAWAVRKIQSVEGPEVAEAVHMIVNIWNERIYEKRRRASNVLGVGPID